MVVILVVVSFVPKYFLTETKVIGKDECLSSVSICSFHNSVDTI